MNTAEKPERNQLMNVPVEITPKKEAGVRKLLWALKSGKHFRINFTLGNNKFVIN